jgi:hypothetical protein
MLMPEYRRPFGLIGFPNGQCDCPGADDPFADRAQPEEPARGTGLAPAMVITPYRWLT